MQRIRRVLCACAALLAGSQGALAQSIAGNFEFADRGVGMQSVWSPAAPSRIQHTGGSPTLRVDMNDNGAFNDAVDRTFTLPAGLESGINYELSPTKRTLYVSTDGQFVCGGLVVHFLDLPLGGGAATVTHTDCLPGGLPFSGFSTEYFDTRHFGTTTAGAPVTSQRIAWVVTGESSGTAVPEIHFYDLTSPGTMAVVQMSAQWNWIKIARSGNFALIKHDVDNPVGTSDYMLVNLCSGPAFGGIWHLLEDVSGIPTQANARLTGITGGNVTVEIFRSTQVLHSQTVADCLALPGPVEGACCVAGACSFVTAADCATLGGAFSAGVACSPSTCAPTGACCVGTTCSIQTEAACLALGGAWSQGAACTPTLCLPPPPAFTLTGSAPVSGTWLQELTYTITYENTGNGASQGTRVAAYRPFGSNFVRATPAPSSSPFSSVIEWNVGSVPAHSGPRTISLTVTAPCNAASSDLTTYWISATNGPIVNGAPVLSTPLTGESTDPVVVSLSTSAPPAPLAPGAISTHTLLITNDSTQPRRLIISGISPGASAAFVECLTPSVGTWSFNSLSAYWQDDFAPGETKELRFTSTVESCIANTVSATALNGGGPVIVRSRCGNQRGASSTPASIALLHPVSAEIAVAPSAGVISAPLGGRQIITEGVPFELRASIVNNLGLSYTDTMFTLTVPTGITLSDPPYVGAPPEGLTFDPGSGTFFYYGPLPSTGMEIRLAALIAPGAPCDQHVQLSGGSDPSCFDLSASLHLFPFGGVPAPDSLLVLASTSELWAWNPLTEAAPHRLGCVPGGGRGITRAPDGRLFIIGDADIILDPSTLAITEIKPIIMPQIQPPEEGYFFFNDGAWDATNNVLLILAQNYSNGNGSVIRFDPATNIAQRIVTRADLSYRYDIMADAQGRAIVPLNDRALRFDLAAPLPLPSTAGAAIVPPAPVYSFSPGVQPSANLQSIVAREGAGLTSLVRTGWFISGPGSSLSWNLFSLSRSDASDAFSIIEPQLAWNGQASPPPLPPRPAQFTPLIDPMVSSNCRLVAMGGERSLLLEYDGYPTVTLTGRIVDLSGVTSVTNFFGATPVPFAVRDVLWIPGGPAFCPADWNHDGGVDGDDVIAFFAEWDANNADFNHDGGTDGDDIIEFFSHWDANC